VCKSACAAGISRYDSAPGVSHLFAPRVDPIMRPLLVKAVVVLAVLAAAAGGYAWLGRGGETEPRYRTAKVERGPISAVVAASGTLNAVTTVQVGSQVSGQIKEILADFNTAVKKDQIIARIDPSSFELRVSQARADLDAARSAVAVQRSALAAQQAERARLRVNLLDAERDYRRKKTLVEKNFLSPAERDKAQTLFEATREQLRAAQAQGIAPERLVFSPRIPFAQHLARYRAADLALDTFPYTSHSTASDALWAGCPVVALCGETFASRVSGSILTHAGLPELITGSMDDYGQLARQLATDPGRLEKIRTQVSAAKSSSLFDAESFTRDLERVYLEMRKP